MLHCNPVLNELLGCQVDSVAHGAHAALCDTCDGASDSCTEATVVVDGPKPIGRINFGLRDQEKDSEMEKDLYSLKKVTKSALMTTQSSNIK